MVTKHLIQDNMGNFKVVERLVQLKNGRSVSTPVKEYTFRAGEIDQLKEHMYVKYDTEKRDIEVALRCFEELGHNKAEFGMFGGFMWTEFVGYLN